MCLISTFATTGKQYPDLEDAQYANAVYKAFNVTREEQKSYLASTSSVESPDEEKNIAGTLGLLELAKWAQEQKWEWKGSPNVGVNHDAYFYEAAKEDLEDDDDEDNEADEALEAKRQRSL